MQRKVILVGSGLRVRRNFRSNQILSPPSHWEFLIPENCTMFPGGLTLPEEVSTDVHPLSQG